MQTQQNIAEALAEIVRRFAPKNRASIPLEPGTHLVNDAGIDSPRMIDITLDIEDRFGVTVEDADIQKIRTFGELTQLVFARVGEVSA